MDISLIAPLLVLGACAGVLAGMLGIGGGILIVPVLLLIFEDRGIDPAMALPMALATSLATIVFTSASAAWAQIQREAVVWPIFRSWLPGLLLGSLAAGFVAQWLPTIALRLILALFLAAVGVIMLRAWVPDPRRTLPGPVASTGMSGAAGLTAGLTGIGGGNIIVPTLVWFNVPMVNAVGTSSALGLFVAAMGALGYAVAGWQAPGLPTGTLGYIHLTAVAGIAVLSIATARIGVALAHRVPAAVLKRCFGVMLLLFSTRMFAQLAGFIS